MKIKIIVILLMLTLILSSCTQQVNSRNEEQVENKKEQTTKKIMDEDNDLNEATPENENEHSAQNSADKELKSEADNQHTEMEISDGLIGTYSIVDTNQTDFYSDRRQINEPSEGEGFYGQDASYNGNQPSYTDNGDGTVLDNVTGLMWQQTMDDKMTYQNAFDYAKSSTLGGYDDWRLPTIKELWSLMDYTGQSSGESADVLYIDTDYFDQPIGDTSAGEREIDAQVWSATEYTGVTLGGARTAFGVNFVDGRIKGYPTVNPRQRTDNKMYVRLVRGNTDYGINNFVDNEDGTISDLATGLMWQQADDGQTRNWAESLEYAESSDYAGYSDWRLPNAKELQSIVDYNNSMQENRKAAISDLFSLTEIIDAKGDSNYGFYWTSTTHLDGRNIYDSAAYVCFGEALGKMNGNILDVHGAGALRSDPKSGDADDYPQYRGPQGDLVYVYNFCLLVRDIG